MGTLSPEYYIGYPFHYWNIKHILCNHIADHDIVQIHIYGLTLAGNKYYYVRIPHHTPVPPSRHSLS
jgi:hypothetical protein